MEDPVTVVTPKTCENEDPVRNEVHNYLKARLVPHNFNTDNTPPPPISDYLDIFFTFIEFGKYLYEYFKRLNDLESMLTFKRPIDEFLEKFKQKNVKCLEFAKNLNNLVGKFENHTSNKSLFKSALGIGTSAIYDKMVRNSNVEQAECAYVVMQKFAASIVNMESKLSEQLNSSNIDNIKNKYIKASLEAEIGYTKLKNLLDDTKQPAGTEPTTEQLAEGGSIRHTRRRRHRRSIRSRKLINRSKKGKKIMKQHTKNRRINIRKQKNKKTKSRK